MDAAVSPFPSEDKTPPVTNTYFMSYRIDPGNIDVKPLYIYEGGGYGGGMRWYAIGFSLCAAFFIAIQGTLVKMGTMYMSTDVKIFGRSVVNLALLLVWAKVSGRFKPVWELFRTKNYKLHLVRSLGAFIAMGGFYLALVWMPVSDVTMLILTAPIFVPLLGLIFLKRNVSLSIWMGMIAAWIGIIFVLEPSSGMFHPAGFLALGGAVFAAASFLAIEKLNHMEPVEKVLAHFFALSTVLSGMILLIPKERYFTWDLDAFLFVGGIGVTSALLQFFITLSMRYAPAHITSPFLFASVIFALVPEILIWDERPTIFTLIGFLLVVGGSVLVARRRA